MNMQLKTTKIVLMLLVSIFMFVSLVNAVPDFQFTRVDVDGITVTPGGNSVFVERGGSIDIDVFFEGVNNSGDGTRENVRVKAWLGGYEFGDVEAISGIFTTETNVSYRKSLTLQIPSDIDASKDYTLYVQIYDDIDNVQYGAGIPVEIRLQEKRHLVEIQDVIFNPGLDVDAGKSIFATIRVENLGDRDEDDVKVKLVIPQLGLETRTYIDALSTYQTETSDIRNSASSNELALKVPENTKAGDYELKVQVEYNRGHDITEKTFTLTVKGITVAPEEKPEVTTVVNIDTSTKQISQGEGTIYKVSFANLGKTAKTFTLELSGITGWATSRIDPGTLTVQPDQTQDAYVYVAANENASPGMHAFTLRINSDGTLVKEINLGAEVLEGKKVSAVTLKAVLILIFAVLIIILVLLGIVLAIKKLRESKSEEPSVPEAATYYYYPAF